MLLITNQSLLSKRGIMNLYVTFFILKKNTRLFTTVGTKKDIRRTFVVVRFIVIYFHLSQNISIQQSLHASPWSGRPGARDVGPDDLGQEQWEQIEMAVWRRFHAILGR